MIINYANQKMIVEPNQHSIFLAGPAPRSNDIMTWRKEALAILESLEYDGIVYVPEASDFKTRPYYDDQACWERHGFENAKCILFWIPREKATMPAFTTNVEFGYWIKAKPNNVIYGRPNESEENQYLDWLYAYELDQTPYQDLTDLLQKAITVGR